VNPNSLQPGKLLTTILSRVIYIKMATQIDLFLRVLEALHAYNVEYILIGGVAVILHGLNRLTHDIDIFINMEQTNIERLRGALHSVFDDDSIEEITFEELQGYPVIRYGTPQDFYIDILTRLGDAAAYHDLEYEILEYQGVPIRIGTPETLYHLKKDTVREKDHADAVFLRELLNNKT
jgi:hypothetical protein